MGQDTSPSVARHIKDWEFQELENAAQALADLERHPGWAVLQGLVSDEVAGLDRELDVNTALEQATYALKHGRRGGLTFPRDVISTVLAKRAERKARLEAEVERDNRSPAVAGR